MPAPVLLSLGSVNADFQARTPRPLQAGETLQAHDFVRLGGGKAANVAFLAHRLGHTALLLGRVGGDDLREQRLVSMHRPHLVALRLELIAENWSGRLKLRSALNGAITNGNTDRRWLPGYRHLEFIDSCASPEMLLLAGRTIHSDVAFALAARTRIDAAAYLEGLVVVVPELVAFRRGGPPGNDGSALPSGNQLRMGECVFGRASRLPARVDFARLSG